ncbi:MAG: CoA pyrophosphatase [Myxococcota bacterium]
MDPLFEHLRERLSRHPARALNLPGVSLRESAVLVPLFLRGGVPHVLFTKRPMTLRSHAGQISFPGGARDPEDATSLHTALRETYEELGVPAEQVEILGMLDEIPTISRFRVVPYVGVIPGSWVYRPSAEEIEEIIEAPLPALMDPAIHRAEKRFVGEGERKIYFYDFGPHIIWGATARILKDLLHHIAELAAGSRFRT